MKKGFLVLVLIVLTVMPLIAGEGNVKAGAVFGSPTALTAGFRLSDLMEVNALLGIGWGSGGSYYGGAGFLVGANLLFTVVHIDINGQDFPLSLGPQVHFNIGTYGMGIDALFDVRWEYTFENIPLNLFVEVGGGINWFTYTGDYKFLNDAPYNSTYNAVNFKFLGTVGVRYVF